MGINQTMLGFGASKSAIRELAAYGAARKAEIGTDKVFDFSLGNPSIPAPPAVRTSIAASLELPPTQLHGYTPASGLPQVRDALAASLCSRFGEGAAHADDLYLSCGAAAAVSIALHAVCVAGDEVLVVAPYFPEYKVWIETAGARCVEVPANAETFHLDVETISTAISSRTKAIIINSPNNPVGVVYPRENLEALADVLTAHRQKFGSDIFLISDEPYREIVYGAEVPWVPTIYDETIVCYSYSKSLSLPGERIGWVLVPPTNPLHDELIPAVAGAGRALGYVCAPALFQRLIADCADTPADVAAYQESRDTLCEGLSNLGYSFVKPEGAFYLWVKALEEDAQAFSERAKNHELLVVPSDSFGCKGWVRVSYCVSRETIERSMGAWDALKKSYE